VIKMLDEIYPAAYPERDLAEENSGGVLIKERGEEGA
jgi:hypothetical protein